MKLSVAQLSQKIKIPAKAVAKYAIEAAMGFLLSNIGTAHGFAPFGVAYASNTTLFGLLGTIGGYAMHGTDFWRYLIASCVAYIARAIMQDVLDISPQTGAFFYAVWGSIVGGVGGIFIYSYSFRENLLFMLGGAISGVMAYVFSVARFTVMKKTSVPEKLKYICFFSTAAVLVIGVMSLSPMLVSVGIVIGLLMLLCIAGQFGFLYTAGAAMLLSFTVCLYSTEYLWLSGVIIVGTVFACLLREFGRNSQVFGFMLSNVLVGIYCGGSYNIWSMLANIVIAGIIYTFLPKKTLTKTLCNFLPGSKKKDYLLLKRKKMKPSGKSGNRLEEPGSDICRKCSKKMLCWIKNYNRTISAFEELPLKMLDPAIKTPGQMLDFCVMPEKVVAEFRKQTRFSEKAFVLDFAKLSICKSGETVCGDCCNVFFTADSRCVVSICDGMGCGTEAAAESREISVLLENMLKKGFDKNDALLFLNQILLLNGKESVAGLDMLFIDLISGGGQIVKANAAKTFVFRQNNLFEIGSVSAPIGALESVEYYEQNCIFIKDDIIIMTSDGYEAAPESLAEFCRQYKDSVSLASNIIKSTEAVADDITVFVAYLN